jgi:poly(U)-specific endoribonuclease
VLTPHVVVHAVTELKSLSSACNRLWELDANRLEPNVHYELNLQEGKSAFQRGDVAGEPLFAFVDPCVFDRPTYKLLFELLDNYERGVRAAPCLRPAMDTRW